MIVPFGIYVMRYRRIRAIDRSRSAVDAPAGVVSNISQCQIALNCAIARARSRKVSCATVYLIFISLLTLGNKWVTLSFAKTEGLKL